MANSTGDALTRLCESLPSFARAVSVVRVAPSTPAPPAITDHGLRNPQNRALPHVKSAAIFQGMTAAHPEQPTRQAIEAKTRSAAGKVTGKLREAIDLMVENATPWDDAGRQVGLTARTMRLALQRPHVMAYLKARREVFRATICTANIRRLATIRDAANNLPAVQAIRVLEGMDAEHQQSVAGRAQVAGFVIVLREGQAPQPLTINATDVQVARRDDGKANDYNSDRLIEDKAAGGDVS